MGEEVLKNVNGVTVGSIKDSGSRRDFGTGAVRDLGDGKGRFDLMPLDVMADLIKYWEPGSSTETNTIINKINSFMTSGNEYYLFEVLVALASLWDNVYVMMLEVSKHFEEGCNKYPDKNENGKISPNMMKGIPVHCYIDSGVRHFIKYTAGMKDEPHDKACVWNLMMCIWTIRHRPDLNDINYKVYAGAYNETTR